MLRPIIINRAIKKFNKKIEVDGDKSLSIRFVLLASKALGKSRAYNLLKSEDVLSAINCLKKLGVKIRWNKKNNFCEIIGYGLNSYVYKKNMVLNAGNSGTTARLICATLINSPKVIKITGDKSLKKRDMKRIIKPLEEFGATFKKNKGTLPLYIKGSNFIRPINYFDNKIASAQCKSSVMLAALLAPGQTQLKCKPSRNHTELLFKHLKIPIKINKKKKIEIIKVNGGYNYKSFNYNIPCDISSGAFFIVLTLLSNNSKLILKKIGVNNSRIGAIQILKKMGAKITFKNKKSYKGEKTADIHVRSSKSLKSINCPTKYNSSAIDEFLIIFLVAAKAKGISYFKNLEELNKKESRRLDWGSKILSMMGVKNKLIGKHGIKIWGQPNLKLNKSYEIKNYLKDHRVMAMSTIAALTLGGKWKIHNPESIKTSFPSFFKILQKDLGSKINT